MPYFRNKNNIRLYYDIFDGRGKENGNPPVVMLHGFGSSAGFFSNQIKALRPYFKIIVFDAEGHGKSEKNPHENPTCHLITDTVEDLQELLYLLKIDDPLCIIGHSLVGGGIGQKMALLEPSRVKCLILLNSGNMYIDNPIRNIFWNLLPPLVRMEFKDLVEDNLELLLDKTIPFIRAALVDDEKELTDYEITKLDGIIEQEIFNMIKNPMDPSGIKAPTLIIGAELDNYAPLWMSYELAEKIKGSEFEIVPMAGHFGPAHRPEIYNKIIMDFLRRKCGFQL